MSKKTDDIFSQPLGEVPGFKFDQRVVAAFPDMIKRSVPGYESMVAMTGLLAQRYARPGTNCYDLGCSLGASTLSMAAKVPDDCKIIAVDNSSAMLTEFAALISGQPEENQTELVEADIRELPMENANFVAMNLTLQFVPLEDRAGLIQKIADGMNPGAALLVSEKIEIEDAEMNSAFIDAHHEFKRMKGYSELEIAQKRQAIENVLIPETVQAHQARFKDAGFKTSAVWFQCLNFCSLIALKASG